MSESINMKLSLDENCNLVATYIQDSDLEILEQIFNPCDELESKIDFNGRAIVEFATDYKDDIIYSTYRVHEIESEEDPEIFESAPMELPKDGGFTYYRIILPTYRILNGNTKDVYFVYTKNGESSVYRTNKNITNETDILDSYVVLNGLDIWEQRNDTFQDMYYFSSKFFSLCRLNNCLIELERKLFAKYGCDFSCSKGDNDTYKRDFILTTIHILEYLSKSGRYEDAQEIIDTVLSCGGLCENVYNRNGGCGCGKTI